MNRRLSGLVLAGVLALGGCASLWRHEPALRDSPVELTDTAFFPQRAYQCGPAALATVLDASGVQATPDGLASSLYIPDRHGTLQVELMAAARRHGRLAVVLQGQLPAVIRQLEAGRPVLVLQNLLFSFYPLWHYAVVVGYQPSPERVILRSGRTRRRLIRQWRFEDSWRRADRWAMVVLAPADDPAGLAPDAYLQAAADLESTGAHGAALTAFRSAEKAWPEQPLAALGEANNLYYLGRYTEAADAYRRLLDNHPHQVVAVHNLVMLLLERRQPCEARDVLDSAAGLTGELMDAARQAVAAAHPGTCPAGGAAPVSLN